MQSHIHVFQTLADKEQPGPLVRSDAHPPGVQTVTGSIHGSGDYFLPTTDPWGYSYMKVVYMCLPKFENGVLRERPLTEKGGLSEKQGGFWN